MSLKKIIITFLLTYVAFGTTVHAQKGPVPDNFGIKGFYIDLRSEVMTMTALKNFAKEIADMGMNTLVMEWEATFPYKNNATISNESAYSRQEIKDFVQYCNKIGVDVMPVQECFGHVQYILRHDRYASLREDQQNISQVCPLKVAGDSLLFSDLFKDIASMHTSKYLHIGGDETNLLGHDAACRQMVTKEGKSMLFVNYMKLMCDLAIKLGKIPVMWADMLLKYPEAADMLPKQTILLDWNYGWKTNHFGNISHLQKLGFTFWGAAAIRSHPDNWYVTDWKTHFNNQKDFIPYARKAGYKAMIMTAWSTSGLYSFTWDVGNDVLDMEPIRNNYPLSGFRILIAAYAKSLKQSTPINPKSFVIQYAQTRFGLSEQEGEQLWKTFNLTPELIVHGKPTKSKDISVMIGQNNAVRKILNEIEPTSNTAEFNHYRLMADLRNYYLEFKKILSDYNANNYTISASKGLIPALKKLLNESMTLDNRFYKLNKGFLKNSEIKKQEQVRNQPVENLYNKLINLNKYSKN